MSRQRDQRVEFLEAERARLERLLGKAIEVAELVTGLPFVVLMEALCEYADCNCDTAAINEGRHDERRRAA